MQWFILSQGKRSGPYDLEELGRMLENDKITLDTVIIREGCPVGRRIYSSPDLFFPDLIAQGASTKPRDAHANLHGATRVARFNGLDTNQNKAFKPIAPPQQAPQKPIPRKPLETENTVGLDQQPVRGESTKKGKRKKAAAKTQPQKPEIIPFKTEAAAAQPTPPFATSAGFQNPSPAHQLPKAASEAQLKPRGDFTWAKNRVNPTAPKSIFHSQEKIGANRRQAQQKKMPPELLYIAVGLISIISLMLIAYVANNRDQKPEPRLMLRKSQPVEVESPSRQLPSALVFDTGPKIPVTADKKPKKSPPAPQRVKESVTRSDSVRRKQTAPVLVSKPKKQEMIAKSAAPKGQKKPKQPKQKADSLDTIRDNAGLENNLFKKVKIDGVQLLISPDTCEPCQIPGKLRDGTKILLTSPNIQPWRTVQRRGAYTVKASGFLTRNSQGTYSLIVQNLEP